MLDPSAPNGAKRQRQLMVALAQPFQLSPLLATSLSLSAIRLSGGIERAPPSHQAAAVKLCGRPGDTDITGHILAEVAARASMMISAL